jgi:hypothetical protein
MDVGTFKQRFPEFGQTPDALIVPNLIAAGRSIDPAVWGGKFDEGQAYLAAHKLALSPYGANVRIMVDANRTTYFVEFDRLKREVAAGAMVI